MKKNTRSKISCATRNTGLLLLVTLCLSACVSGGGAAPAPTAVDVTVKVYFGPDGNSNLCAYKAVPDDASAYAGKKISWQSVNESGSNIAQAFEIYFDPLQGQPLKATNGTLSRVIDTKAPKVKYKYTIWDSPSGNDPHVCAAHDPHFRVD